MKAILAGFCVIAYALFFAIAAEFEMVGFAAVLTLMAFIAFACVLSRRITDLHQS